MSRPSRSRNYHYTASSVVRNKNVDLLSDTINEYTVATKDPTTDDDDDYDNDNDDDKKDDVVVDDDDNCNANIKLPGGSASTIPQACDNDAAAAALKTNGVGEIPRNITRGIRDYMDILFSSVMFEALNVRHDKPINVIPGIVNAILEYNNISFKKLTLTKTSQTLHEPIWYVYNIAHSTLNLMINEQMFDMFCMKISDKPVTFSGGVIPIELYNPYAQHTDLPEINRAMINYAIACDHVSQHIIVDILAPKQSYCLGIHDRYTCVGTTLHSIFAITQNVRQPPKCDLNPSNYFTSSIFLGNSNSTLGGSVLNSFRNSSTSVIDQMLSPSQSNVDINIGDYRPFQAAASSQPTEQQTRQNSFHFTI